MRKLAEDSPVNPDAPSNREQAKFVAPQMAKLVPTVPAGGEWVHEIKLDGYRLIAVKRDSEVRMFTRNHLDWTARFQLIANEMKSLSVKDFVMDGEAVVLDEKGRSRFGALQSALHSGDADKIHFVVFDLLHFDGENTRDWPLMKRAEKLAELIGESAGHISLSKIWPAEMGRELFRQACDHELEGIISKNFTGPYHEGARRDWVKTKCRARQEFVVCGYTLPKGSLQGFGALVLASFEHGKLVPRGKVGTGFLDSQRIQLLERFKKLHTDRPAFPLKETGVQWLRPKVVAEIQFSEITADGAIRQGTFIGLRDDKPAVEVGLESLVVPAEGEAETKVNGIIITHPDRVVFPDESIMKLEVVRYYDQGQTS